MFGQKHFVKKMFLANIGWFSSNLLTQGLSSSLAYVIALNGPLYYRVLYQVDFYSTSMILGATELRLKRTYPRNPLETFYVVSFRDPVKRKEKINSAKCSLCRHVFYFYDLSRTNLGTDTDH